MLHSAILPENRWFNNWWLSPSVNLFIYTFIRAIALMMEAACTSETSVNFYHTTRRNNPEDSRLHTRRRENIKSR
jgi:hypothetical protein